MKKKPIIILLTILFTIIIFLAYPVLADEEDFAEAGDEIVADGLIYEIQEDGTVILTDYQSEVPKSLAIPGVITYSGQRYTVTAIEEYTFSGCDALSEVTIAENVKSIGDYAFSECEDLHNVVFPATVTTLGRGILSGSDNVTIEIASGNDVLHYENGMLIQNDMLLYVSPSVEEVIIPDAIHTIASYAFQNCDYIEAITIPRTIETIEEQAFCLCYGLHSITMENNESIVLQNNALTDMEEAGTIYVPTKQMEQHINNYPQSYPSSISIKQVIPYEIIYNAGGGTFKETCITRADNTKTVLLPDVERQGYEFLGWCSDEACKQEPIYQIEEGQSSNVVLYAKWEAVEQGQEEQEQAKEQERTASNRYQLAKQQRAIKDLKAKKQKETITDSTKKERLAKIQSHDLTQNRGKKKFRRQNPANKEVQWENAQVTETEVEIKKAEETKKPVKATLQEASGGFSLNNIVSMAMMGAGVLLVLVGGVYTSLRYRNKRRETTTNEK